MKKHAYLIMAHNNFYILEKLLKLLDDKRNDIYIHIDKKVKDFNFSYFNSLCINSNVIFINRMRVYWGGYTQVQCELNLLRAAIESEYEYYHLLSGVDLPIKSQDYIHDFFEKNHNKEFLAFTLDEWDYNRVKKIHFLNDYCRIDNKFKYYLYIIFNKLLYIFINKWDYDYTKNFTEYEFMKGDNWFSITNECAHYICKNEKIIKKMFRYAICSDEHFMTTLVYNSKFKSNLSNNTSLREIDWNRGNPYVYRLEDYELLMNSENLFARKFDYETDKGIVDKIYNSLL